MTLVEDPELAVLRALAEGTDWFLASTWTPPAGLPAWAYERLLERDPNLILFLIDNPGLPPEIRIRLQPARSRPESDDKPVPEPREVETQARAENEWTRSVAAADPALPAECVARLALDPAPLVRLAVSMRPELSEEQRAGIDYHVGRDDRIRPAGWAVETLDHQAQRRCAFSAHIGLRRSVACNPNLAADLVAVLATDDDFAARLLLCERHTNVPSETVLTTYLEARTMTRGRLLNHPSFQRIGLARLADSPNREARALVVLDPEAPPRLIEQLSNDPDPMVRASTAGDRRLSPGRVLELFDDPPTAGAAAANPHLPVPVMHRVLADAAELAHEVVEGKPAVYLGRWSPDQLPHTED